MINDEFLFWSERKNKEFAEKEAQIIAEKDAEKEKALAEKDAEREKALAEKEAQDKQKIAELMIEDGECAEKIIRYTGIDVSVLKSMAQSLGKVLML